VGGVPAATFYAGQQAVLAAAKWRFKPGLKNGVAVPVVAVIEMNFRLE
jgi:hypothetical protein